MTVALAAALTAAMAAALTAALTAAMAAALAAAVAALYSIPYASAFFLNSRSLRERGHSYLTGSSSGSSDGSEH
ncbi:MAG: hypothetical protein FWE54_04130 [Methanimicrococcus sp.]|nr:hypothetical protein [Methanimicrococcus sp.]